MNSGGATETERRTGNVTGIMMIREDVKRKGRRRGSETEIVMTGDERRIGRTGGERMSGGEKRIVKRSMNEKGFEIRIEGNLVNAHVGETGRETDPVAEIVPGTSLVVEVGRGTSPEVEVGRGTSPDTEIVPVVEVVHGTSPDTEIDRGRDVIELIDPRIEARTTRRTVCAEIAASLRKGRPKRHHLRDRIHHRCQMLRVNSLHHCQRVTLRQLAPAGLMVRP